MNFYWDQYTNAFVSTYLKRITSNRKKLEGKEQELFDLFIKCMTEHTSEADYHLLSRMTNGEISCIEQLFDGSRRAVLQCMLGDAYTEKYVAWLRKKASLPYTFSYYRRPLRTSNAGMHCSKALDELKDFLAIVASGLSLETLMEGGRTEEERNFISEINYYHLMSVEIDAGNTSIIQKTKDIICSDTNAGCVSYNLLKGIVMSNNHELYELEGKLLLAARLQEGLRQSIAETMDCGTTEAFKYLFAIIRTNDLRRFSSIKRAVGTWTGLVNEADADRISQKIMDLIHLLLTDPSYVDACLKSEDSIELYMALWVKGFYNMEDLALIAAAIMEEGVRHKIQVLFYYLLATQCDWMREKLSKQALEHYSDDLSLVAAFLSSYLHSVYISGYNVTKNEDHSYFESPDEAKRHYAILKDICLRMPKKQTYSPYLFPWYSTELSQSDITNKMTSIVYLTGSNELLNDLCNYYDQMTIEVRHSLIKELLKQPSSQIQVDTLVKALGDRAESPRKIAFEVLSRLELTAHQYLRIEELLKYKTGELRQQAILLLSKQTPEALTGSIERLLISPVADKRLAGLDLLLSIRKKEDYAPTYKQTIPLVGRIQNPAAKEQLLIDQLLESSVAPDLYTKENGFGLYDPSVSVDLPALKADEDFNQRKVFLLLQENNLILRLFGKTKNEAFEILEKLDRLIAAHADYEYTGRYGYKSLLGNYLVEMEGTEDMEKELDKYPLAELWRTFYKEEIQTFELLIQLSFVLNTSWYEENNYPVTDQLIQEFSPAICDFYGFNLASLKKQIDQLPYGKIVSRVIHLYTIEYKDNTYGGYLSKNMLIYFASWLNNKDLMRVYQYETYRGIEKCCAFIFQDGRIAYWLSDYFGWQNNTFNRYFILRYYFYQRAWYFDVEAKVSISDNHLSLFDFVKAYEQALIPESELVKELMERCKAEEYIALASSYLSDKLVGWQRNKLKMYEGTDFSHFKKIAVKVSNRILEIELKRGDTPTEVSRLALKLEYVEGASCLVQILKAFGKDTFGRSGYYYNSSYTKKEVLSKLLRCCYPSKTDTAEVLSALLKGSDITETRLVEAAMYAPQWLEIVELCLGWEGLTSAAYYFHAHINEWCDDKKKAIIARYTPIEPEDLRLGAFDINWFREAYNEIGEKRFDVIYNAAKYISSGAGHTRARKYADAVNGKMIAPEVKKEIEEKRNKDLLMSYCLIPLANNSTPDLLERYQYLQQFLKESKTFGSQRQESEKNAVEVGMQNLARNAGYSDVTRLVWSMETELIKDMEPYFTPLELEGVEVYVQIDEEGKSELKYSKAGKALNNVPAKLKKHPYIEELKTVHKKLKNQYSRSRVMLEQAMEDETYFLIRELHLLTHNPVVWPLLKNLVFVSKEDTGFFDNNSLVSPDGTGIPQEPDTQVRIAHPVDLYNRNIWYRYQQCLFEKGIRQPFKQVFRELYVKTDEELNMPHSLRYAGNQIQPQKTVALLKSRRWIANHEEGLQKVYYKENIVACIYALADWFSPADIEAPTLEWIEFTNRKTFKPLTIAEIPEVIFSEVMRDVDLAVSVAHAGSVDPEASHSTIEMRRAIIEFTLPLFKFTNVTLKDSHALIKGSLGNYNIHLGSGIIHQEAGTAIHVLPVHSQHRGRLFLPFVDEDPKTAEVVSKIILFAEDKKIKDPFILRQIGHKKQ